MVVNSCGMFWCISWSQDMKVGEGHPACICIELGRMALLTTSLLNFSKIGGFHTKKHWISAYSGKKQKQNGSFSNIRQRSLLGSIWKLSSNFPL